MEIFVTKATLSTGKVVLIREPRIKDQDLATRSAASKSKSDNNIVLATAIQKEMIKALIVDINGSKPSNADLEDLDRLFTYREYLEVASVVNKVSGGGEAGESQMEQIKISGG